MKKNLLLALILIFVAVLSRLIPHGWNFTAMGAVAVASGLLFRNRVLPMIVVLLSLLISDTVIGFHNVMLAVYLGYVLMTFAKTKSVMAYSLIGSIIFFIVSNFGVWMEGQLYPATFSGLMLCYQMALPFFRNELISTMLIAPILFYGLNYYFVKSNQAINVA